MGFGLMEERGLRLEVGSGMGIEMRLVERVDRFVLQFVVVKSCSSYP